MLFVCEQVEITIDSFHSTLDYPVWQFGGTKSVVFSTVSFIGGRNPFLGIAYIVVAGICVLFGLLLTLRHLIKPRKLGDMRYLRCVILSSLPLMRLQTETDLLHLK